MTGVKEKVLTLDTMNSSIRRVEYAVRGPIVLRALELEQELRQVCPGPRPRPPGCTWAAQSAPFPPSHGTRACGSREACSPRLRPPPRV